jgi:16S rRNA (guanine966-N2)-methyltransferase
MSHFCRSGPATIPMPANPPKSRNRLRIIGGTWRSRVLPFGDAPGLRPTPDRIRETLFNWLQMKITGARCLDLFAGSGALGFEALSRGASHVTALELHAGAAKTIAGNAQLLQTEGMQVLQQDALPWLANGPPAQPFDVVFVDPPFASRLQPEICHLLQAHGWLKPCALVYLEAAEALESMTLPAGWVLLKSKRAGEVHYGLCQSPQVSAALA